MNEKMNPKARTPPPVYAPADAPWVELPAVIKKMKAVKAPWLAPVPELAHGLSRVLHNDNSKATPIWTKIGGKPASAYVRTIVQPQDINWEAVPAFVPPSFDDTLHALSLKHKVKYKASTSSITGLLSHVYQVLGHAYLRGHVCCVDDVVCSPLPSPGCFVTVYRWPPAIWAEPGHLGCTRVGSCCVAVHSGDALGPGPGVLRCCAGAERGR